MLGQARNFGQPGIAVEVHRATDCAADTDLGRSSCR